MIKSQKDIQEFNCFKCNGTGKIKSFSVTGTTYDNLIKYENKINNIRKKLNDYIKRVGKVNLENKTKYKKLNNRLKFAEKQLRVFTFHYYEKTTKSNATNVEFNDNLVL